MKILKRENRMTDAQLVDEAYIQAGVDLFEGTKRPKIVTSADLAEIKEVKQYDGEESDTDLISRGLKSRSSHGKEDHGSEHSQSAHGNRQAQGRLEREPLARHRCRYRCVHGSREAHRRRQRSPGPASLRQAGQHEGKARKRTTEGGLHEMKKFIIKKLILAVALAIIVRRVARHKKQER